ncbi:MAG: 3-deoxy-7-phosphoheptulonate synthase, partial [bacterium]|nr:3-deoxy-7-phosphoheptulonate synthase [bacterium]
MIVVMKRDATAAEKDRVYEEIRRAGLRYQAIEGVERTVIGVIGTQPDTARLYVEVLPGVEKVIPILKPYKLSSRELKKDTTVIRVNGIQIGGNGVVVAAGPCSVEDEDSLLCVAKSVKESGAALLRGGAFKPRTSPYSFQGHGEPALKYLARAREETGLPIVTEVMDTKDIPLVAGYADILQVGARNMSNFSLLKALGDQPKPVLLKRGRASTVTEMLMSAEYILSGGNMNVILCERGIRTFENGTRNTLDISAVPALKEATHLPVFVDPSHGTGRREYVEAMSRAAIAAGADGLLVEVHHSPETALS